MKMMICQWQQRLLPQQQYKDHHANKNRAKCVEVRKPFQYGRSSITLLSMAKWKTTRREGLQRMCVPTALPSERQQRNLACISRCVLVYNGDDVVMTNHNLAVGVSFWKCCHQVPLESKFKILVHFGDAKCSSDRVCQVWLRWLLGVLILLLLDLCTTPASYRCQIPMSMQHLMAGLEMKKVFSHESL